jgi:hypothetical protein
MALLNLERQRFLRVVAAVCAIFMAYAAVTLNNLQHVFANTERGAQFSYGVGVLPLYFEELSPSSTASTALILGLYALAYSILLASLYLSVKRNEKLLSQEPVNLAAFRLGAAIYVGTFLLGNNWDYRLIFLLFTIPQTYAWAGQNRIAKLTLAAMLISLAHFWFSFFLPFAYFLDEFANWVVFAGLLYLSIASLPDWLQAEVQGFVTRRSFRIT